MGGGGTKVNEIQEYVVRKRRLQPYEILLENSSNMHKKNKNFVLY
jgi:hypothetical protein